MTINAENEYKGKEDLKWIEDFSRLLDSKFTFPGTQFKFGLDPLIGLIPGLGNAVTFAVSGLLVYTMSKHGVSRKVVILMMINILLDAAFGSIPVIGNVFDFFYKANDKNVRLLKRHYQEGRYQGSGTGILVMIFILFLAILAMIIYGIYKLFEFLLSLL